MSAEVRMTVGMLREDEGPGGRGAVMAPLPGVEGLPALVERFRSAGADITLAVQGDTSGLPATTGLAVYRIAQEALTNAVKHAPDSPTALRLKSTSMAVSARPSARSPSTSVSGVICIRAEAAPTTLVSSRPPARSFLAAAFARSARPRSSSPTATS